MMLIAIVFPKMEFFIPILNISFIQPKYLRLRIYISIIQIKLFKPFDLDKHLYKSNQFNFGFLYSIYLTFAQNGTFHYNGTILRKETIP